MDLEDLRAVQTRERTTDGLQDLRDSFYEDVAAYIEELRERREQAAKEADDPFGSEEVQSLTDEIETAEQVAEAIYERRIGKLVKQASLAAAGVPDEREGLTPEERDLYADIVDRIEENKSHVLDVIGGDVDPRDRSDGTSGTADAADETRSTKSRADDRAEEQTASDAAAGESSAAAAMGEGLESPDEREQDSTPSSRSPGGDAESADAPQEVPPDAPPDELEAVLDGPGSESDAGSSAKGEGEIDRTTVRITEDVGEIFGVDERSYTLEAEDVVTLPEENAEPLLEREAAEELGE